MSYVINVNVAKITIFVTNTGLMKNLSDFAKKLIANTADILIELGKLAFAGLVIGGILTDDINKSVIISTGGVGSIILLLFGTYLKSKHGK